MNVFEKLNQLNKEDSVEADKIADTIPKFILSVPNISKYNKIELYNMWIQCVGYIPKRDEVAIWALEFISYVANEIPVEMLRLQLNQ